MLKVILALLLMTGVASAQTLDPRLAPAMVQAMQAQLNLLQEKMKLDAQDAEAQKATLWQWLIEAKNGNKP